MSVQSKHSACPVSRDGRHAFTQAWTPECTEPWQFQMVCLCKAKKSDEVYGIAPKEVAQSLASPAQPAQEFSLDNPSDVTRLVVALFDASLDWPATVRTLLPSLTEGEVFTRAAELQADERVTSAIDSYVASLTHEKLRYALLLHLAEKLSRDANVSGAVQSTALNILKSARIVEKSEHQQHGTMRIEGLEKGIRRMLGEEYVNAVASEKPVN